MAMGALYELTSPFILSSTFALYIFLGNEMTAPIAFSAIILFRLLEFPLMIYPTAISEVAKVWISLKRVEKYLLAPEMNMDCVKKVQEDQNLDPNCAVKIENGTFYWELEKKDEDEEKDEKKKEEKKKAEEQKKAE